MSEIVIQHSYADDDSCQMQLYAKGHHGRIAFILACREFLERYDGRILSQGHSSPVRRTYWRTVRASSDHGVCDYLFKESSKGRGAWSVTLLDRWLPLHVPKRTPEEIDELCDE